MGQRRPRRVYGVGEEPDPRFSLANERTLLAWLRTGLALVVAGVALVALADLFDTQRLFETTAALAFLGGGLAAVLGYLRWARIERALRLHQPLPAAHAALVVLGTVLGIALIVGLGLVLDL